MKRSGWAARCMALVAAAVGMVAPGSVGAQVQGAGASFPSKVYAKWAERYEREATVKVVYKPTGSGDGVKQIGNRAVNFGGTDVPLPPAELARQRLVQLPMVVGGIVPVINLPGVADGRLQLDGPTLADLMSGKVARWDDARIAALNRGLALPALPVRRIVRADKSGTTEGLTRYLAQVSAGFQAEVGVSQQPAWPGTVLRAEGNDGMAKLVKDTPGALAYVSYDRVARDGLAGLRLRNAAGVFVAPSEPGFRSAIMESDLGRLGDDRASLMDRPGVETWPITTASFVLVDAEPRSAGEASPALRFLYWCFMHGDDLTKGTGFAPLPTSVQSRLAARFATIKAQDQQPLRYVTF